MATLHTYIPRCPAKLECFLARPAEPAGIFQHSPGESRAKHFPVCTGGCGGGDVLTPGLRRTIAFWAALTGEGQA
jgi:hypothetical protein